MARHLYRPWMHSAFAEVPLPWLLCCLQHLFWGHQPVGHWPAAASHGCTAATVGEQFHLPAESSPWGNPELASQSTRCRKWNSNISKTGTNDLLHVLRYAPWSFMVMVNWPRWIPTGSLYPPQPEWLASWEQCVQSETPSDNWQTGHTGSGKNKKNKQTNPVWFKFYATEMDLKIPILRSLLILIVTSSDTHAITTLHLFIPLAMSSNRPVCNKQGNHKTRSHKTVLKNTQNLVSRWIIHLSKWMRGTSVASVHVHTLPVCSMSSHEEMPLFCRYSCICRGSPWPRAPAFSFAWPASTALAELVQQ